MPVDAGIQVCAPRFRDEWCLWCVILSCQAILQPVEESIHQVGEVDMVSKIRARKN